MKTNYSEFDIKIDEIADFMYILGNYQTCVELYDKYQFAEDASWLSKYFYALKQLGQASIAEIKLQEITKKIDKDILEEELNPVDWESDEDCQYYISSEKNQLKAIRECYNNVFTSSIDILPAVCFFNNMTV